MSKYQVGKGYIGSKVVETSSTTDYEILPNPPSDWTIPYNCYKFEFINDQACSVIINNETELYRRAGQGFVINEIDKPIISFKIKESGISYTYTASY